MATIRTAGSKSVVDLFGAISATANTLTHTVGMAGRAAQAGYAWTDAWAAEVEANAEASKKLSAVNAQDNAIAKLVERSIEIQQILNTDEKKKMFNELKAKHFGS